MSFETGLNFELLLKNPAVSKRHCKTFLFEISCWKGKYVSYDPKCWALPFSSHSLIFIVRMISYRDDADKFWSEGFSSNLFDRIRQPSCFNSKFNFIFVQENTADSKKCNNCQIYFYH